MNELNDLIATLPRDHQDPRLAGLSAVFRFVIDLGTAGIADYHLLIDDGRVQLLAGPGDAATIFYCSADDFRSVFLGGENLMCAVLQGRVDVDGNLEKFFVFYKLLKVRQTERDARAEGSR
jgi:hypothetical protein